MFYFHPKTLEKFSDYAFYTPNDNGFSKEQCESVLSLWDEKQALKALTGASEDCLLTHQESEKRQSRIQWINYSEETRWIFEKLCGLAFDVNDARYKFQLNGFVEPLQLTEYREGDHYDWHTDGGEGKFSTRKLSLVVQLSDENDYTGGELQVLQHRITEKEQGTVLFFPSYSAHKVHPVTSGLRYSLVAWISGEPFR